MKAQRFLLTRLCRGIACILGALVVLLTALFLFLQLESVQKYVFQRVLQHVDPTLRLELSGTHGLFPGRVKIDALVVARRRPDGTYETYFSVDHLSLKWDPWALLGRRLDIETLTAQTIIVAAPESSATTPMSIQDLHPLVLFEKIAQGQLPIEVTWHTLEIGRLELPEWSAIGVSSEGHMARDFHVNATLDIVPLEVDSPEGYVQCILSPDAELTLEADLKLPPNAALAETLRFPAPSPVHLHLEGAGKIQDWSGILRLDAGSRGALMGRFSGDLKAFSTFKLMGAGKIGVWPEAMRWIGSDVTFHIEGTHPTTSDWTFQQTYIRARDFELYVHGQLAPEKMDLKAVLKVAELAPYGALFDMPLEGSVQLDVAMGGMLSAPQAAFSLAGAGWIYGDTQVKIAVLKGILQPEGTEISKARLSLDGRLEGIQGGAPAHVLAHVPPTLTFTLNGLLDFVAPLFEWHLDVGGGEYRLKTAGILTPETSDWQGEGVLMRQNGGATMPSDTLVQTTASGGWADEKKNSGLISN